jgi:hemerythrin
MALITWNNDLSVNIKEFDEEHKKLISMINDLHSAMGSGKGKETIGPVLSRLVDYTKTHFAAEEKLMLKHGYPGYVSHKALHDDLTKQVVDLQKKLQEGKMLVTVQVMNFLRDWLSNHIQNTDKKYGPFFIGKGIA